MGTITAPRGANPPRDFNPDVLFVIFDGEGDVESYVRTPDGVGAYWYDGTDEGREEARESVSTPVATHYFDDAAEFASWRQAQEA